MQIGYAARGAINAERMRQRMFRTGVTPNGYALWDAVEVGNLTGGYPDYNCVLLLNRRRTRVAHHAKASRLLITKPKAPEWDENELPRLRRLYPSGKREDVLAAFPGRSWRAISAKANSRGIYRAKKPLKPSCDTLLDQILVRARERNFSLADLDEGSHGAGYFKNRKWRRGRFQVHCHFAAVLLLGGRIRAREAKAFQGE
jgi:diadenosine tetraphosphatase ApaH/serine/threonine PP2A family protein phosphatase